MNFFSLTSNLLYVRSMPRAPKGAVISMAITATDSPSRKIRASDVNIKTSCKFKTYT